MVMSPDILTQREKGKLVMEFTPIWLIKLHNESRAAYQITLNMTNFDSVGFIGLMEAIERYDDDKNVPFRVYAEIRSTVPCWISYEKKIGCQEIFVNRSRDSTC